MGAEHSFQERGAKRSRSAMDEPAISLRDVTAGYDGRPTIEAITLEVEEGDFYGIIGPNGGGKSTLLKVILGLIAPMKGAVRIMGLPPEEGRRHIGYLPQYADYDKVYPISVWDVALMGRRSRREISPWYSSEDRRAAEEALDAVNMLDHRERNIGKLSGGQRQRVFIARALASRPKILLLDEPTASVDPEGQESIFALFSELNKEMTILLVSHDVGMITTHVNKLACINRTIVTHDEPVITPEMLQKGYSCPVDLIAHGDVPHRMLRNH